jgi:F0F1-type ATP synthase assembly protein I
MQPPARNPWSFLGLGFELIVPIVAGVGIGYWLDRRWGTKPWLLLTGAILGIALGFLEFFRRVAPPKEGAGPK